MPRPRNLSVLGQNPPTVEQFKQALVQTQKAEESLRQRYVELMAWANTGPVPGVVVRSYMKAALEMNRLLQVNSDLYLKAGGKVAAMQPIPMVRLRREISDEDLVTAADLQFEPCPPDQLGAAPLAPLVIKGVILLASIGGAAWITSMITDAFIAKYAIETQRYITQAVIAVEATKQAEAFTTTLSTEMQRCVGNDPSKYNACLAKIGPKLKDIQTELPDPSDVQKSDKGLGFFGWIGVVVFVGSVGALGYALWKRRRTSHVVIEHEDEIPEESPRFRREAMLPGE